MRRDDELRDLVRVSYEMVSAKLPSKAGKRRPRKARTRSRK